MSHIPHLILANLCVDRLYACGVTEVFASVATKALNVYGIEHQFLHLDSSSFHLHGQYDVDAPDEEIVSITYGYSLDHRPDLKQAVAQIITSHKSNLPVWLEVLSGNSSDKESFCECVKVSCEHLTSGKNPYFMMDSAGIIIEQLSRLHQSLSMPMRVVLSLEQSRR